MRFLRILGATLLMVASGFVGGAACLIARAVHGWDEFQPDLLFSKALVWTLGFPMIAFLAILVARGAGEPSEGRTALGVATCLSALALAVHGIVVLNKHPQQSLVFLVPSFLLCIVSSVLFAGRPRAA